MFDANMQGIASYRFRRHIRLLIKGALEGILEQLLPNGSFKFYYLSASCTLKECEIQ